jgi:hypothetical protein
MKIVNAFTKVGIAVLGWLLVGCSGTPVRLGSANQYTGPGDIDATTGRNIKASASGFQLLLFIPININDRQERAFQLLQAQAGGDYVTNIAVDESWIWAFVGTVHKTTMTATAYRRAAGAARPAQQPRPGAATPAASLSQMCDLPSLVDKAECLGRLRLGMSKTLVTNLLGPSTETLGNGSVLRYDDRYLKFDSKDLLIGITEARPQ